MVLIKPAPARAVIADTPKGLQITIPTKKNYFIIVFLGLWLIGWLAGAIGVPVGLFRDGKAAPDAAFVIIWLLFWLAFGGFTIYAWLWNVVGKEIITVDGTLLSLKHDLLGRGRVKQFELAHVRYLRPSPLAFHPWDFRSGVQVWGLGGGTIAFDYGARTYRFGSSIDEAEARQIAKMIAARYKLSE